MYLYNLKYWFYYSFNLRTGQAPQDSDSGISTDGTLYKSTIIVAPINLKKACISQLVKNSRCFIDVSFLVKSSCFARWDTIMSSLVLLTWYLVSANRTLSCPLCMTGSVCQFSHQMSSRKVSCSSNSDLWLEGNMICTDVLQSGVLCIDPFTNPTQPAQLLKITEKDLGLYLLDGNNVQVTLTVMRMQTRSAPAALF